ncbi:hypothetical protein BX666DRAFT_811807 [Dichotomocladium elegans]|nr:hypothetical protein BX666DRAFT_811807 [Dichotomocladium elegans]
MLVDLPLTIDSNDIPELVQPQPLSPTASLRSNSSSGTTSSRMRNLFRRTSNNLSRQTTQSSSRSSSSPSISSIATDTRPVKPMPPPFTPITEEEERIKRANAKSTPIPEFDTGVYTFQMFEESSDEEYVPINAEQKNPAATSTSTSAAAALPTRSVQNEAPPQTLALSKIPTSSDEGPSGSVQYGGGTDGDRDFDGGEGIRKTNEPRSPTTTASTTTHDLYSTSSTLVSPLSPPPPPARTPVPAPVTVSVPTSTPAASASAAPSSYQDSYHHNQLSVPPLYSDANNAKLDFISESDTDEHSDDSDDEPDLLSVVARREQRIQRQKTRTIPSA